MPQSETVERILRTATLLFAERGFAETSMRTITSMADVNLAAVNYHFGSKKALIQAVFTRFLDPLCQHIEYGLNNIDKTNLTVPDILWVIARAFDKAHKQVGERPEHFARLMNLAYSQSQEHLRLYCSERYETTINRLQGLLRQAAPQISMAEFYWRLNFMLGASLFSLSSFHSIMTILGEKPNDDSMTQMCEYLVPAMGGMLQSDLQNDAS